MVAAPSGHMLLGPSLAANFPCKQATTVVARVGTDCATDLLSYSVTNRIECQRRGDNALRNVIVHIMHAC